MRENSVKGIESVGTAVLGQSFGKDVWLGRDLMEALECLRRAWKSARRACQSWCSEDAISLSLLLHVTPFVVGSVSPLFILVLFGRSSTLFILNSTPPPPNPSSKKLMITWTRHYLNPFITINSFNPQKSHKRYDLLSFPLYRWRT